MIDVPNLQTFSELAEEILVLFDEGSTLRDTYPLWRRWEELRRAMPKDEQRCSPWIVCDFPQQMQHSIVFYVDHPTNPNDSWRMQWRDAELDTVNEPELRECLSRQLRGWLRAQDRKKQSDSGTISSSDACRLLGRDKSTLGRWAKQSGISPLARGVWLKADILRLKELHAA